MRHAQPIFSDARNLRHFSALEYPMNFSRLKLTLLAVAAFAAFHLADAQAPGGVGAIFKRFDKNGDGKVTPGELPDATTFARFDRDKDGVITLEETVRGLLAGAASPAESDSGKQTGEQLFTYLDTNADGALTADELPGKAKRLLAVDGDGDGRITRAEALGALETYSRLSGELPTAPASTPQGAAQPVTSGPRIVKGGDLGVGRMIADLELVDQKGAPRKLSEVAGKRGLVIALTSATCPVSKRYAPSLATLEKDLRAQGVGLLLVNPYASDRREDIQAQLAAAGISAAYVHDQEKKLATALGARTTTEVFLLDATRTLLYRGALDDQYGVNYNLDAPRANYLRDAVSALLASQRPTIAATEAPGCELDLPSAENRATTQVTYHRDVARILQQNCVTCHRDQGIAPFPLDDLAEVQDRSKVIKRVISERAMPPWFAAPVQAGARNPWANDCSLAERDKADLLAWIGSADRPLGNPAEAPAKLVFPDEWTIGKPDYIVQLPQPVAVKADGFMPYQFITAETTLSEDKWVQGYEILPTDRSVVHHVIVNVHAKGTGKLRDREEGVGGFWAAYVPGNGSQVYPAGFARKLPAGSRVSFQIHYTPSGKATQDQLRMGLIFAKETPRYLVETVALPDRNLNIPPGAADHVETASRKVPVDLNVMAFVAHMHVRGKAFKYELLNADGTAETLLDIPRYDFNWQLRYELAEPRFIPRGSTLRVTAVYDNSPGNKANPDPTKTVRWGPQTYEEMMIGYIETFSPIAPTVAAK